MNFGCIVSQLGKQRQDLKRVQNAKCKSEDKAAHLPFYILHFEFCIVIIRAMKHLIKHTLPTLLITLFIVSPAWATCGGGGGGGVGGMSSGGAKPVVYNVHWKVCAQNDPPAAGLVLYWFPVSNDEIKRSSL